MLVTNQYYLKSLLEDSAPLPCFLYQINSYDFYNYQKEYTFIIGELCLKISFLSQDLQNLTDFPSISFSVAEPYDEFQIIKAQIYNHKDRSKMESIIFEDKNDVLTIGSSKKNKLSFNDHTLSKVQCRILYDSKKRVWKIVDGNEGKKSTNGTWLLLSAGVEVVLSSEEPNEFLFGKSGFSILKY
jgi:hypothetical protein